MWGGLHSRAQLQGRLREGLGEVWGQADWILRFCGAAEGRWVRGGRWAQPSTSSRSPTEAA